jgi:hypothetical protein
MWQCVSVCIARQAGAIESLGVELRRGEVHGRRVMTMVGTEDQPAWAFEKRMYH